MFHQQVKSELTLIGRPIDLQHQPLLQWAAEAKTHQSCTFQASLPGLVTNGKVFEESVHSFEE